MYRVTKQYAGGGETFCKEFKQPNEAKAFIQENLLEDANMKIKAIYRLYEWDEVLEQFDSTKIDPVALQGDSGSQGQGKGATFRPTPLNKAPRPAGTPQKWVNDEDEDKK